MPSKCPNYYHIDLHVDDDLSVAQNGRSNGFRVFLVGAQDDDWDKKSSRKWRASGRCCRRAAEILLFLSIKKRPVTRPPRHMTGIVFPV